MPSLEMSEMRVRAHDVTAREPCGLGRRQLHGNLVGGLLSELALQSEYDFELSVVPSGPERFVGARGAELGIQLHTAHPRVADCAVQFTLSESLDGSTVVVALKAIGRPSLVMNVDVTDRDG